MAALGELMSAGKEGFGLLVDAIIRPPRCNYKVSDLGPTQIRMGDRNFVRTDLQLVNKRGMRLECSHYQPVASERPRVQLPCVIYAHGNAGSRLDAAPALRLVLPYDEDPSVALACGVLATACALNATSIVNRSLQILQY